MAIGVRAGTVFNDVNTLMGPERADKSFAQPHDSAGGRCRCVVGLVYPGAVGHRGKGVSGHLLTGAIDFARRYGAPAIEGYPVDNNGRKVAPTTAYIGTRKLFERAGFTEAVDTSSVFNGFLRIPIRLKLR